MTFIEAAIEVLRREGRPLHYDKITELALKYRLLSHVGKNPEATMAARLALQVKVPRPDSPFVKTKPGIFSLAEWKGNPPGPRKLSKEEIEAMKEAEISATAPEEPEATAEALPEKAPEKPQEKAPEELDEEPKLSKNDLRQRRLHDARPEKPARPEKAAQARDEKPAEKPQEKVAEKSARPEKRDESPRPDKNNDRRRDGGRPPRRRPLAEIAEEVLRAGEPRPLSLKKLSQAVSERGGEGTQSALAAALRVENERRRASGLAPLFRRDTAGAYSLAEWGTSARALELEAELHRTARERHEELLRELGTRLVGLNASPLEPLLGIALERAGFTDARVVRRSSEGNLALVARSAHNLSRGRTLFLVRRQGPALTAKDISELRAALPGFGAQAAVALALTGANDAARTEAGAVSHSAPLSPVAIWDERGLASLLAEAGVGVLSSTVPALTVDAAFFAELEAD